MAIGVSQFQVPSFEQSNPFLTGLGHGQALFQQFMQNQYLRPLLQQELQKAQLANQIQAIQAQYAGPQAEAELGYKKAQTGLVGAQTGAIPSEIKLREAQMKEALTRAGLTSAQAELLKKEMPYQIAAARGQVFRDPMLARLYELQQARQTGAISPELLSQAGLGQPQVPPGAPNNEAVPLQGAPPIANQLNAPQAFTGDALRNFAAFGGPMNPVEMQGLKAGAAETARTGVTEWNKDLDQATQNAAAANDLKNFSNEFWENYKKSTFTGALAKIPGTGFLGPEALTDQAVANLQSAQAKLMGSRYVTQYDIRLAGQTKPSRALPHEAADISHKYIQHRAEQFSEEPRFKLSARTKGVDAQTADTLWRMYLDQRPAFDWQTGKAIETDWRDYLSDKAINSARTGQFYLPNIDNPEKIKPRDVKYMSTTEINAIPDEVFAKMPKETKMMIHQRLREQAVQ